MLQSYHRVGQSHPRSNLNIRMSACLRSPPSAPGDALDLPRPCRAEGATMGSHQPLEVSKNSPQQPQRRSRGLLTFHLAIWAGDLSPVPACPCSSEPRFAHWPAPQQELGWPIHLKTHDRKLGTLPPAAQGRGGKAQASEQTPLVHILATAATSGLPGAHFLTALSFTFRIWKVGIPRLHQVGVQITCKAQCWAEK